MGSTAIEAARRLSERQEFLLAVPRDEAGWTAFLPSPPLDRGVPPEYSWFRTGSDISRAIVGVYGKSRSQAALGGMGGEPAATQAMAEIGDWEAPPSQAHDWRALQCGDVAAMDAFLSEMTAPEPSNPFESDGLIAARGVPFTTDGRLNVAGLRLAWQRRRGELAAVNAVLPCVQAAARTEEDRDAT